MNVERKQVLIFPDHCSTGLWLDHVNVDPDELKISKGLQLALKYWHEMWEFNIALECGVSQNYIDRWNDDGMMLCELMSQENDTFYFIYKS